MQASTEKFSLGKFLREVRAELKKAWPYVNELEERVKDKLVEIVKMYTGEHTNG